MKAVLFLDPAGSASSFPAHSVLFIFLAYCTAGASVPCSSAPGTGPRFSASSGQGPGQLTATLPSAVVWSLLGLWQRDSCSPPPPPARLPVAVTSKGPGISSEPLPAFRDQAWTLGPQIPLPTWLPAPSRDLKASACPLKGPEGGRSWRTLLTGRGRQARAQAFSSSPQLQVQTSKELEPAPFEPGGGQCGTGGEEQLGCSHRRWEVLIPYQCLGRSPHSTVDLLG